MMKKVCLFITTSMLFSMVSFSQTIKENIEKQSKDPKTAENAAKADVYILDNKRKISDTTAPNTANHSKRKPNALRKKKQCGKS